MTATIRNVPLVTAGRHAGRRGRTSYPSRHANQGGDPVESARLRPLFLVWLGNRSQTEGFRIAGIPYHHGTRWIGGYTILAESHQAAVRELIKAPA